MAKHFIVLHIIKTQGEVIPHPFVYTRKRIKNIGTKFLWAMSKKENNGVSYRIEMHFQLKSRHRLGDVCFYKGERNLIKLKTLNTVKN